MHRNAAPATYAPTNYQMNDPNTYVVQHYFDSPATLTTTLVHALSNISGATVSDAEQGLFDHVDPDALNRLFRPSRTGQLRANSYLQLKIWGYDVTIHCNGQINITVPRS
jgi:hypothetical protein